MIKSINLLNFGRNQVLITDKNNSLASIGIKDAFKNVEWKSGAQITFREVSEQDSHGKDVCSLIFDENIKPSFLLDVTMTRTQFSDDVKILVRRIGLPSASISPSASFWDSLTDSERDYLIHFNPPQILINQLISDLVDHNELKSYAIFLCDKSFGKF